MRDLQEKLELLCEKNPFKIILSKERLKTNKYKKVELIFNGELYKASKLTQKQVFHEQVSLMNLSTYCADKLENEFKQLNAWNGSVEFIIMISSKGLVSFKQKTAVQSIPQAHAAHNRDKNYILKDGTAIAPLVDMGIFTQDGKIVNAMYDKFKQINRFIELIDDAIKTQSIKHLNIIDFGCGKSYLTFVLYYYFTKIKNITVNIIGLDLKVDVINKCNEAAIKYGYENLHFELGDINGYKCKLDVDMVISLHACDTATDYALYNAVKWNAKMIFSVPCCQHELNGQIFTEKLSILTKYGIIKERLAALSTDAIRANLLEVCGYNTQVLEFVDISHTPKNLLIRAVKKNSTSAHKKTALQEVEQLLKEFNYIPTLYNLLKNELSDM